jgi:hypothetical protein
MNMSTNTVDPRPQDLEKIQEELRMLEREKEKREKEKMRQTNQNQLPFSQEQSLQAARLHDPYKSDNFGEDEPEE